MRNQAVRAMAMLVVPLLASSAAPPTETIELGTITLTLGMPQDKVLDSLATRYKIEKMTSGGDGPYSSWLVQLRSTPFAMIGNVTFTEGKLWSVIKDWGPDDQQKGIELADALYGAIERLVQEGRRSCVIDASTKNSPGGEAKAVSIMCGGKRIELAIDRFREHEPAAFVEETLQSAK